MPPKTYPELVSAETSASQAPESTVPLKKYLEMLQKFTELEKEHKNMSQKIRQDSRYMEHLAARSHAIEREYAQVIRENQLLGAELFSAEKRHSDELEFILAQQRSQPDSSQLLSQNTVILLRKLKAEHAAKIEEYEATIRSLQLQIKAKQEDIESSTSERNTQRTPILNTSPLQHRRGNHTTPPLTITPPTLEEVEAAERGFRPLRPVRL